MYVYMCTSMYVTVCYFRLRAPVGRMTVIEQQLEGSLRYVHSRVITNRLQNKTVYI